jgi:hypothetical protein
MLLDAACEGTLGRAFDKSFLPASFFRTWLTITFMRHPVSSLGDSRTELRANGAFWLIEMSRMGPSTSNEDVMVGSVSRISGAQEISIGILHAGWPISGTEVMVEDDGNLWLGLSR